MTHRLKIAIIPVALVALAAVALFGALTQQGIGTAEAQTPQRMTTLGAVEQEREARAAEREAARNAIHSTGCEFQSADVVVPPQFMRPADGYFWVLRDCFRQSELFRAESCEPVRVGNVGDDRVGWLLLTSDCEIPSPERVEVPQAIECNTRTACEVEVTFRDGEREVIRTMQITFEE